MDYHQAKCTQGLFKHETRDISFTLVVDDLGIKHTDKADVDHLIASLEEVYTMTLDMDGINAWLCHRSPGRIETHLT